MYRRFRLLYHRYATRHLHLSLGAGVVLRAGRIVLEGDGPARLEHGATGVEGAASLSLPFDRHATTRVSQRNTTQTLPPVSRTRWVCAHVTLWPRLGLRLMRVLPLLPRRHDPHIRARVRRILGLGSDTPAPPLTVPSHDRMRPLSPVEIAIILPVHNAREHVLACLDRLSTHTDLPHRVVIIEDGSTDPALRPALTTWVEAHPQTDLICHDTAKGFAAAVNAALAHLTGFDGPIVLLNSDTTLPQGWASRLIAPLLRDGMIASVTPLSNEGELMGVPHACAGVALRNTETDAVDRALKPFARDTDLPALPTGSGFCMALSPHWLAEVPCFDESFGRGYGEEVDWCQRTRALGGRHVCQTGLFVGHVGAASFGRQARQKLRAQAAPVLAKRWPRFDGDVQQALAVDPLATERLRAGLLWAKTRLKGTPLPVYLAHSLGGGTARWLSQRLARQAVAVVLRVGGPMRWQLELHTPSGVTRGATDLFGDIGALLALAGPREVIYTCAVGDPKPEDVPFHLLDLCAGGQGLEILFHDYFPLNCDYTLRSETDATWQALWRPALERADHLTVFSRASERIVAQAHPDLAHKIRLRPHAPLGPVPRLSPAPLRPPVIGVPGNLNAQKGAEVVARLAQSGEAKIVVLGDVAPDCALPQSVTVVGGYDLDDLPHLVARYGIGLWVIPSIWPETFSYVTQEALATGLPVFGFDLGGQGEALRAAPNGQGVALRNDGVADVSALLREMRALPGWPEHTEKTGSKPLQYPFWKRVGA